MWCNLSHSAICNNSQLSASVYSKEPVTNHHHSAALGTESQIHNSQEAPCTQFNYTSSHMCCCWSIAKAKCQEWIEPFLSLGGTCSCQLLSFHLSSPPHSCVSSHFISSLLLLPFSPLSALRSSPVFSSLLLSSPLPVLSAHLFISPYLLFSFHLLSPLSSVLSSPVM